MTARLKWLLPLLAVAVLWGAAPSVLGQALPPSIGVKIDGQYGFGLPPDVSEHGYQIDRLIWIMHWFMAVLFVGWGIFFVRCLLRYRQRSGHTANYELLRAKPAKWSEVGVMIVEVVLLVGFSMPVWASVKNDVPAPNEKHFRIRVIAEQFAWNFHYPGPDGVFGKSGPQFIDTALNPAGLDLNDPAAKDDLVQGEFHLPIDEKVVCEISSKDVIHSFFLPVLRVKQDAIPGMRIPVWFKAKKEGNYEVACAQLCGNNHYNMKALMVIQSRAAFEAWYETKMKKIEFTGD